MNEILNLNSWNPLLLGILFALLLVYVLLRIVKKKVILRMQDAFIAGLLMYILGSVFVWAEGVMFSENVLTIALLSGISAISGSIALELFLFRTPAGIKRDGILRNYEIFLIGAGLVTCTIVSFAFLMAIYTNNHTRGLFFDVWHGQVGAFNQLRINISSGVYQYVAPGYVKQFRDIAAPIMMGALVLRNLQGRLILFLVPLCICSAAVYISGQRLVLLQYIVVLTICGIIAYRRFGNLKMAVILSGAIILQFTLLIIMTNQLGRNDIALSPAAPAIHNEVVKDNHGSIFNLFSEKLSETQIPKPVSALIALVHRSLIAVPRENVITIRMWESGSDLAGAGWVGDIATVLPGTQRQLSNRLALSQGSSDLGNSPLGMPADLFYNWGFIGLLIFPFFFSLIWALWDFYWDSTRYVFFEVAKIYLFISIPFMYSPFMFILYGGAFTMLLFFGVWVLERLYTFFS